MSYSVRRRGLGQTATTLSVTARPATTALTIARPSPTAPAPAPTTGPGPQSYADCAPGQGFTRRTDGTGICFNCPAPMPGNDWQRSPWSGYRPPPPGTCGEGVCSVVPIPLVNVLQPIWFPCTTGDRNNAMWMRTANVASALIAGGLAYRRWKTPGAAALAAGAAFVVLPGVAMGAVGLAFRGLMTR